MKNMPKSNKAWLEEIAEAYLDAKEAIPFGEVVDHVILENELLHMAPQVCLKFRGLVAIKSLKRQGKQHYQVM